MAVQDVTVFVSELECDETHSTRYQEEVTTTTHGHVGVRETHVVLLVILPQNVLDKQIFEKPFMLATLPTRSFTEAWIIVQRLA